MENYGLVKLRKENEMIKCIVIMILMFSSSFLFSQEITLVKSSQRLAVNVAKQDVSSIQVVGDRIRHVHGNQQFYFLSDDPTAGIIYLKPHENIDKTFSIYLDTENHRNIHLLLTPVEMVGNSVVINPVEDNKVVDEEESSEYLKLETLSLLQAMAEERVLKNYRQLIVTEAEKILGWKKKGFRLIKAYEGNLFFGFVYRFKKALALENFLEQFNSKGIVAIAIQNEKSVKRLFIVFSSVMPAKHLQGARGGIQKIF